MPTGDARPPRVLHGTSGSECRPWVEVSALVELRVPSWEYRDETWVHFAVPVVEGSARIVEARRFSPGRVAGTVGEPPAARRSCDFALDGEAAGSLASAVLAGWRPTLLYQPDIGVCSDPDESPAAFRRRILAGAAPLVRRGDLAGETGAAMLARLAGRTENRTLGKGGVLVRRVAAGVVWYPEGLSPGRGDGDLMLSGRPVRCR